MKKETNDKNKQSADDNNNIDKSEINEEIVRYLQNLKPRKKLLGIDPEEFWKVISNIQTLYAMQLDEQEDFIKKLLGDMNDLLDQNTKLMRICNEMRINS